MLAPKGDTLNTSGPHSPTDIGPRGYPIRYKIRDVLIEPNVVLAPMEGVTNLTFRRFMRQLGGAGLVYTEFIAAEGLRNRGKGNLRMAEFDPEEDPIAIQIFGKDPWVMAEASKVVEDLGAAIIDINMGCPSKKVCAHSGGSALMKTPLLAAEIVREVRKATSLPLTVKMRSGFDAGRRNAPELAKMCQEEGAEGITIHWRTREDRYGGQRQIDKIAETKALIDIPLIANGDIVDIESAKKMFDETGCDGVMIGRGSMKNPWALKQIAAWLTGEAPIEVTPTQRQQALLEFLAVHQESFRTERSVLGKFKQFCKHFCEGIPDGSEFRRKLLRSSSVEEVIEHVHLFYGAKAIKSLQLD